MAGDDLLHVNQVVAIAVVHFQSQRAQLVGVAGAARRGDGRFQAHQVVQRAHFDVVAGRHGHLVLDDVERLAGCDRDLAPLRRVQQRAGTVDAAGIEGVFYHGDGAEVGAAGEVQPGFHPFQRGEDAGAFTIGLAVTQYPFGRQAFLPQQPQGVVLRMGAQCAQCAQCRQGDQGTGDSHS